MRILFKLGTIGGLMLLLLIPIGLTMGKISERADYRYTAKADIASIWTGEQQVLGPIIVQPYSLRRVEKWWNEKQEKYVEKEYFVDKQLLILPENLQIAGDMETELRRRGIYEVPVYTSDLDISGRFSAETVAEVKKQKNFHQFEKPYLFVHIRDIRGIDHFSKLVWDKHELEFLPGTRQTKFGTGVNVDLPAELQAPVQFSFKLRLRGMDALHVTPTGKETAMTLNSSWPHPKFVGNYLPGKREISQVGFTATWQTNQFATDIKADAQRCLEGECYPLTSNTFGVSLVQPIDIYFQSERAVKYALLFIGLAFTAFFLLEVLKSMRIHPVQYLLVGFSMAMFYLLLISFAEYLAFFTAYLISAAACVALTSFYVSFVLRKVRFGLQFAVALVAMYTVLFFIISAEDYALMTGSLLLFGVLALAMYFTRHVDWYALDALKTEFKFKKATPEPAA